MRHIHINIIYKSFVVDTYLHESILLNFELYMFFWFPNYTGESIRKKNRRATNREMQQETIGKIMRKETVWEPHIHAIDCTGLDRRQADLRKIAQEQSQSRNRNCIISKGNGWRRLSGGKPNSKVFGIKFKNHRRPIDPGSPVKGAPKSTHNCIIKKIANESTMRETALIICTREKLYMKKA